MAYTYCDGFSPSFDLIFPEDKFGESNTIIKAKLFLDQNYKVKKFEEISILYFDGDNFNEMIRMP